MKHSTVYTITVIDMRQEIPLGIRRTPMICTNIDDAVYAVKNNVEDLADSCSYQYAVIEQSLLNVIRPNLEISTLQMWFKYNSITDEFESCSVPEILRNQTGFGIG